MRRFRTTLSIGVFLLVILTLKCGILEVISLLLLSTLDT